MENTVSKMQKAHKSIHELEDMLIQVAQFGKKDAEAKSKDPQRNPSRKPSQHGRLRRLI